MRRTYYSFKRAKAFAQELLAQGIKSTIWADTDAAGQTFYSVEW